MAPKKATLRVITLGGAGKGKGRNLTARTRRIGISVAQKQDDPLVHTPDEESPALNQLAEEAHVMDSSKGTYQNRKERAQENWDNVRQAAFVVACSMEALAESVAVCSVCRTEIEEVIRCRDCGAYTVYCKACEENVHMHVLHKPEIWNVGLN